MSLRFPDTVRVWGQPDFVPDLTSSDPSKRWGDLRKTFSRQAELFNTHLTNPSFRGIDALLASGQLQGLPGHDGKPLSEQDHKDLWLFVDPATGQTYHRGLWDRYFSRDPVEASEVSDPFDARHFWFEGDQKVINELGYNAVQMIELGVPRERARGIYLAINGKDSVPLSRAEFAERYIPEQEALPPAVQYDFDRTRDAIDETIHQIELAVGVTSEHPALNQARRARANLIELGIEIKANLDSDTGSPFES